MISRDSDTYIIDRELAAVQEWMSSNEHTFHVMRDHPYHCIEILGGTTIVIVLSGLHTIILTFSRNVGR